jgi:hypothetical protein
MTVAALTPDRTAATLPELRPLLSAVLLSVAAHAALTLLPLASGSDATKAASGASRAAVAISAVLLPPRVDPPDRDAALVSAQAAVVAAPPATAAATAPARTGEPAPAARPPERPPLAAAALAARVERSAPMPVEGRVVIQDLGAIDVVATGESNADAIAPFRDSAADTPPRLPDAFLVGYPAAAFDGAVEGTQRVLVLVNVEGTVDFVVFEQEHPWFGPTIEAALRSAPFAPAQRNGKPVLGWLALQFEFQIVGGGPEVAAMRERAAVRVTP